MFGITGVVFWSMTFVQHRLQTKCFQSYPIGVQTWDIFTYMILKCWDHNALYRFALYVPICFQLCRIDLIYFIWFLTAWSGRTWWISRPQWWPWPSLICSLKLFHGINSGEVERQYPVYAATLTFKIGSLLFLFGWLALVSFSFLMLLLLQHLR